MVNGRWKTRGSTLPEVLVALTILSCISVVVFQVLARVGNGNYQELQQEAIRQANNRILDEPPERVFKDTLSMPPITVMVTQDSIPGTPLWLRRVEVKNQEGKRLCYRERIVK